jgi:hypothetical protein
VPGSSIVFIGLLGDRNRPLHLDWKYERAKLNPWKIEVGRKVWQPTWKVGLAPFSLAYKKRACSPNRIKYTFKRVDWDPNGEMNPRNRGKSKYKRISESASISASASS